MPKGLLVLLGNEGDLLMIPGLANRVGVLELTEH